MYAVIPNGDAATAAQGFWGRWISGIIILGRFAAWTAGILWG